MYTLLKKWDSLKKDNIVAWLFRVADKHIKNTFKQMKREENRRVFNVNKPIHELPTYSNYNDISEKDVKKYIDEIYEKLSDEEKEIYELRYRKNLTLREIVKELNMPYGTLYYQNRQLEVKLKNLIKEIADMIEI
jgi:RNA polymerase sigma factor (sigma-70 family)